MPIVNLSPARGRLTLSLILAVVWTCAAAFRTTAPSSPVFTDIAAEAGIRFRNLSGSLEKDFIFEAKGGGAGLLDFDRDGFLDIFMTGGNTLDGLAAGKIRPNALYRNNRDGTFTDVTSAAGVRGYGWSMGCAVGDYDNDGWPDVYVLGLAGNILYRNNHDGTFADVTAESGLRDGRWSTSAAFVDYDRDGFLDVYVAHYSTFAVKSMPRKGDTRFCNYRGVPVLCGPRGLPGEADALYHNNRDGTFTDVSAAAGILGRHKFYGLGVVVGDYDNDGWPDIYVSNDSCMSFLFVNKKNGTFEEAGLKAGVALSEDGAEQAGMGVDFGDYDNDGWLDLAKSNFAFDYNNLYHNDRDGMFTDRAGAAGLAQPTMPFVSWATRFFDYDNDGWKDILTVAGHVYPQVIANPGLGEAYFQRRLLFRNRRNGTFEDVSLKSGSGILQEKAGRGAAFGDLDNDGDVDVVVSNLDDRPSILRNDGGNRKNWITLALRGTRSNRFGLGARIKARAGSLEQVSEATTAGSIFSAQDPRVHFGLGAAEQVDLDVRWPSGTVQTFKAVQANRIVEIDEERGLTAAPGSR